MTHFTGIPRRPSWPRQRFDGGVGAEAVDHLTVGLAALPDEYLRDKT
ncbi:hypothetical protein [Streptomyces sp. NBC_01187]|nr:hypothetical protein OG220_21010 [Streptomyces sp. NBC_01187]